MSSSLPPSDDLSFLAGKTLEQVCIGRYQTLLNFLERGTIEVACGLEVFAGGQIRKVSDEYCVGAGIELVRFLGGTVKSAEKLEGVISLQFDDEICIRLLLRGDGYESVNVSGGPLGNLTFY